uniref:Uncharacterized protein n=1 Tax=Chlamydomonas leiostraca TaxID=1034604 RepID=A0A7S0WH85_9CHLO|mmetsp:Transcript_13805/g.33950  ORF Transcript_13805/g.33950 Transcript_13805/m.33950 type:complete len:106 (+) Transcript_13805:252-569(+)
MQMAFRRFCSQTASKASTTGAVPNVLTGLSLLMLGAGGQAIYSHFAEIGMQSSIEVPVKQFAQHDKDMALDIQDVRLRVQDLDRKVEALHSKVDQILEMLKTKRN